MKMIDYLKRGGVQLCLLLLISVSITAQVRKKRPVVKRTATTQAVRKADLVYFDLKGKAHTCIVWSNAGGEKDKRIFDANGIRFLVFCVMQKGVLFNIKKITNILIGQST